MKKIDSHSILGLMIAGISSIVTINPVLALPDQDIQDVLEWAHSNPELPELSRGTEYYNTNTYGNYSDDFSYSIQFDEENNLVTEETISISNENSINFVEKTDDSIALLEDIYDSDISEDFADSEYLGTVEDMDFYEGDSFGYIVNQYQETAVIRIISLDHLQAEMEHQQYCVENPSNCDI